MVDSFGSDSISTEKKEKLTQGVDDVVDILETSLVDPQLSVLEELADVGGSTSCGSNSTSLFCKKMIVQFRHPDLLSDISRLVTVRLSVQPPTDFPCNNSQNCSLSSEKPYCQHFLEPRITRSFEVLLIEIYDDDDPFILLQSRLTPVSFAELRQEQRLLVDFQGFPGILIQLLERCDTKFDISHGGDSRHAPYHIEDKKNFNFSLHSLDLPKTSPSFATSSGPTRRDVSGKTLIPLLICNVTSLASPNDTSYVNSKTLMQYRKPVSVTFTIVETNNFRELTHLLLQFVPAAQDVALQHLAERLKHIKTYTLVLKQQLEKFNNQHKAILQEHLATRNRLSNLNTKFQTLQDSLTKTFKEELSKEKHQAEITLRNREKALRDSYLVKENQLLEKVEGLEAENRSLKADIKSLQQKFEIVSSAEQTAQKQKISLTEMVSRLSEEIATETSKNATLTSANRELEEECRSLCLRLAADQKDLLAMKEKHSHIEEDRAALNLLRQRESELCLALHTSAVEISKGNKVIETLQQALRRERAKNKQIKSSISQDSNEKRSLEEKLQQSQRRQVDLEQREENLSKEVNRLRLQVEQANQTIQHQALKIEALETQLTETTVDTLLNSTSSFKTDSILRSNDHLSSLPITPPQAVRVFPRTTLQSPVNPPSPLSTTGLKVQESSGLPDSLNYFSVPDSETSPYPAPKPIRLTKDNASDTSIEKCSIKHSCEPTLLHQSSLKESNKTLPTTRSTDTDISFGQSELTVKGTSLNEWCKGIGCSSTEGTSLEFSVSTYDSGTAPHFGLQSNDSATDL